MLQMQGFYRTCCSFTRIKNRLTRRVLAFIQEVSEGWSSFLKYRFPLLLMAIGAKIVKWLGIAMIFFEFKHQYSRSKLIKLIAFCFLIPIRHLHKFATKAVIDFGNFLILGVYK